MNKEITWVTPIAFIDNNIDLVPYLAKKFRIHWIILANQKPPIYEIIKQKETSTLEVLYYQVVTKWYSPMTFLTMKQFYSYLKSFNSDIIYINNAPQLWSYYAARLVLPKEKLVLALHNAKIPKGARNEGLAKFYMKKVIRNFHNFQVFSLNQKEYLESCSTGKNILFAPLPLLHYGKKVVRTKYLDKINFLAFGFIRRYKRFDLLIEAAQLLYEDTRIDFVVTIAGNCNDWDKYQSLIRYPHLFDLQIGYIADESVAELFSNCDYLVQPYQDLAQSGPLLLSFYYNVPVIVSDIPPFKEFVQEGLNGYMFKTEDPVSLKEVMKALMKKDKVEKELFLKSLEGYVKDNYSFERLSEKYQKYFNNF